MTRSPMGIGSITLAVIALAMTALGMTLRTPHEMTSVAIIIALSGAAVALEGKRVEEGTSPAEKRWGFWLNVLAIAVAATLVGIEIVRRTRE